MKVLTNIDFACGHTRKDTYIQAMDPKFCSSDCEQKAKKEEVEAKEADYKKKHGALPTLSSLIGRKNRVKRIEEIYLFLKEIQLIYNNKHDFNGPEDPQMAKTYSKQVLSELLIEDSIYWEKTAPREVMHIEVIYINEGLYSFGELFVKAATEMEAQEKVRTSLIDTNSFDWCYKKWVMAL